MSTEVIAYYVKGLDIIRIFGGDAYLRNLLQSRGSAYTEYNQTLDCLELPIEELEILRLIPSVVFSKSLSLYTEGIKQVLQIPNDEYWQGLVQQGRVHIELRPFQIEFLQWMEARRLLSYPPKGTQRGTILSLDLGLGKTIAAIAVDAHFRKIGFTKKTLIICRNNNKRSTWQQHLDDYTNLNYIIIEGDKKERLAAIEEFKKDKDIAIIHYEGVRLHEKELVGIPQFVLVDEAQNIANPTSQQSKVINKITIKTKYTLELSGGVAQNRIAKQLYHPLHIIDRRVWSSFYKWRDDWCTIEEIQVPLIVKGRRIINKETKKPVLRTAKQITGIKDPEALGKAVAPYMYQKKKNEVGEQLPAKILQTIEIELHPKQAELYEDIRNELLVIIKGMPVNVAITKLLRLYQCCATLACFDMDDISAKADGATELLLEIPEDAKVLVFSRFVPLCHSVYTRLKKEGAAVDILTGKVHNEEERERIKKEFKEGNTNCLITTIQLEATGGSYEAASYVVLLDKDHRPLVNEQAAGRIHRLNSKHATINIIDFITVDTIEEVQRYILIEKKKEIEDVLNPAALYTKQDVERMLKISPKK